jgi:archaeal flagellin FlaB
MRDLMMSKPRTRKPDDRAQVGIGTMIVFIATILVAAIAAGVLIDTSQKLQDKSTRTGNEATNNVGTSLVVESAVGSRNGNTGALEQLDVYVQLAPGASPVDLATLILQYNDGDALIVYKHGTVISATNFTATWIRDDDGGGVDNVMNQGDYVRLTIGDNDGTPAHDIALAENVHVDINLVPSTGNQISFGFKTPASFAQDTRVELF